MWLVSGISCAWVLVNGVNDVVLEILYVWFVVISFMMMEFGVINGLCVVSFCNKEFVFLPAKIFCLYYLSNHSKKLTSDVYHL